ncbi:OmpA family protein [Thermovibrio guaymasensis]|uniref:OmpA family protein n=1 Tax=Thermovibrio guaymasensis TaxID=240167 RepID=UPI0014735C62|nr:OmpA family protein [Thermovibrio guaymasensis]
MRIFPLLFIFLSLNSSSLGAQVEYKVLKVKGDLGRRAEVIFKCSFKDSGKYSLTVERLGLKINVEITFPGKEFVLKQPTRKGEELSSTAELFEIKENNTIKQIAQLPFRNGELQIKNLNPQKEYLLKYSVKLKENKDSLLAPKIDEKNTISFKIPIFFQKGSYQLDSKAKLILDEIKPLIKVCNLKVIGYADSTKIVKAKVKSNIILAKERALSVLNYLGVENGNNEDNNTSRSKEK